MLHQQGTCFRFPNIKPMEQITLLTSTGVLVLCMLVFLLSQYDNFSPWYVQFVVVLVTAIVLLFYTKKNTCNLFRCNFSRTGNMAERLAISCT